MRGASQLWTALLLCACGRASTLPPDKGEHPAPTVDVWDLDGVDALSFSARDSIALQHTTAPTLDGRGTIVAYKEVGPNETQPWYSLAVVSHDGTVQLHRRAVTWLSRSLEGSLLWVTETLEGYVLYYDDNDTIYSVWLDHAGNVRNEGRIRDNSGYYVERRMVGAGESQAVVYRRHVGSAYYVMLQRMRADGTRLGGERTVDNSGTVSQRQPDATWIGDGYLVVWRQDGPPYQIYIARTDDSGVALAPAVPLYPTSESQSSPLIWSDGAGHNLVRWWENSQSWFLLVDDDGVPQWTEAGALNDDNRVESFTFDIGHHDGFDMVWESDTGTVFPRIVTSPLALDGTAAIPQTPVHVLSDDAFPCYVPSTVMTADQLDVAFRCPVAGAWRLFLVQVSR